MIYRLDYGWFWVSNVLQYLTAANEPQFFNIQKYKKREFSFVNHLNGLHPLPMPGPCLYTDAHCSVSKFLINNLNIFKFNIIFIYYNLINCEGILFSIVLNNEAEDCRILLIRQISN